MIPTVVVVMLVSTLTPRLVIYCHVNHVLLVGTVDQPVRNVLFATRVSSLRLRTAAAVPTALLVNSLIPLVLLNAQYANLVPLPPSLV